MVLPILHSAIMARLLVVQKVLLRPAETLPCARQISQNLLCGLSFPGAALSRNDNRLVFLIFDHVPIAVLCDHKQVRRRALHHRTSISLIYCEIAVPLRISVQVNVLNVVFFEGIDGEEDWRAYGSVDLIFGVALANRMQQSTLVEVTQREQVVNSLYIKTIQQMRGQ